ncbi:hypothetical protein CCAX7_61130 [Capsulimonas corticalis]|uniref:DUF4396 domain-containing protein n=1 Tax=Capsulimonas corticalis TaxID=2219043 RepID=A0A402CW46_9BACT|nr:DUF4396 domain-containing protein [Capsulimonas corticalis]BDI34062.1 hypothetical protein CCAX7_61130 [Capsulimonas corticalis]
MGDIADEGASRSQAEPPRRSVFIGVTHCGAGCALGDIIAERAMRSSGWTIAGDTFWAAVAADFLLAYFLGIVFQYFSIVPMRGLGFRQGIIAAVKADTLSIVAYEAGMLAWMGLIHFVLFQPPLNSTMSAYWFMMQIAMVVGFAASYPINRWLIKKGLTEAM